MKKILLMGTHPFDINKGTAAICIGDILLLKKYFPNSLIIVDTPLPYLIDYKGSLYCQKYMRDPYIKLNISKQPNRRKKIVHILKLNFALCLAVIWRILKYIKIDSTKIMRRNKILNQYFDVDIGISGMGELTDLHPLISLFVLMSLLILIILDKTIVFFPQTIYTFQNIFMYNLAKFILNRAKIVMVRGKISRDYVLKIGINPKKVHLIPDVAFILPPVSSEDVDKILKKENIHTNSPILGITLRYNFANITDSIYRKNYIRIMVDVATYMQKKYNCSILLIPHMRTKSDYSLYVDFLNQMKDKKNIFYLKNKEYSPEELKGIIGKCHILLSGYMHANIAALSMCVPTINFSYNYKAEDVFGFLSREKNVINIKNLTFEELKLKVEDAWNNREKIRKELEAKMPEIKNHVMCAGELVKKLLDEQESI